MQYIYIIFFQQSFIWLEDRFFFLYFLSHKVYHNSILMLVSAIVKTIEF